MKCAKCNFEFCWLCLGDYKSYRHSQPFGCIIVSITKLVLVLIFSLFICEKLNIPSYTWLIVKYFLSWAGYLSFWPSVIIGSVGFTGLLIKMSEEAFSKNKYSLCKRSAAALCYFWLIVFGAFLSTKFDMAYYVY